jgi:uncharacterized membrane protein YcaP (DUF421 family)
MDSVLRGVSVYLVLLLVLRFSGRRTVAQMTPFDFVLLLIVAETSQQALLGDDFSITNSIILFLTLFSTDIALSYVKRSSPAVGRWLDGEPTVLVVHGAPKWQALQRSRVDIEDVLEAAREQHGLERMDQVKFCVLEKGGNLSIIPEQA